MIVDKQTVRYHADAAAIFAHLGGTEAQNSVLLESCEIPTQQPAMSAAILTAAVRVTCTGYTVVAEALTATGRHLLTRLREQLSTYLVSESEAELTFQFAPPTPGEHSERLLEPSTVEVLRALQLDADYQGSHLPFLGGGFAFEYLETFETLPPVAPGPNTYPDYQFLVAETLLVIDHHAQRAQLEAVGVDKRQLRRQLDALAAHIAAAPEPEPETDQPLQGTVAVQATPGEREFCEQVAALQEHIEAGEIQQVVPARTFELECPDAFAAYRRLRQANPSPYLFYLRGVAAGQPYELFGASPESNVKFDPDSRKVLLSPIAGTRPRGRRSDGSIDHELDTQAELELRTDAKEITEHTMLLDLARNDLEKVAVPGSWRAAELLQVERYSRVMHLVSRVTATLDSRFDALDAYRACMNMGTLTGAPKLRAIELLRGAEKTRRGSYGGAVGYLRGDGTMDTCITIRSAYVQGGRAVVQAGAGVVRDSTPQGEAAETLHKAQALLSAIAHAQAKEPELVSN